MLVEHSKKKGVYYGFTDNYIKVEIHTDDANLDGQIVDVHLGQWNEQRSALLAEVKR